MGVERDAQVSYLLEATNRLMAYDNSTLAASVRVAINKTELQSAQHNFPHLHFHMNRTPTTPNSGVHMVTITRMPEVQLRYQSAERSECIQVFWETANAILVDLPALGEVILSAALTMEEIIVGAKKNPGLDFWVPENPIPKKNGYRRIKLRTQK